jgi:protein-tyrosine phosphatase
MSSDPTITPPPVDSPVVETPKVHFSGHRWFFTGIVRILYRFWTHIAALLFPEDSPTERIGEALHIPLPDRLNMTWITNHLAVGGRIHPEDIRALARAGVTHVVDTRSEHVDDAAALANEKIELLSVPTADTQPLTVEQMIQGARWVTEHMEQGGRVLIHCEHGVGRSVQLTCAVLMCNGMHARDALQLVQEKRWQAAPNYRQIERLREFEAILAAERSA